MWRWGWLAGGWAGAVGERLFGAGKWIGRRVAVLGVAPRIQRSAGDGPQTGPFSHAECMRFERAVAVTLHGVDAVPPGVPNSVFVGQAALLQTDACVGQMQYFCVFALSLLGSVGVSNAC